MHIGQLKLGHDVSIQDRINTAQCARILLIINPFAKLCTGRASATWPPIKVPSPAYCHVLFNKVVSSLSVVKAVALQSFLKLFICLDHRWSHFWGHSRIFWRILCDDIHVNFSKYVNYVGFMYTRSNISFNIHTQIVDRNIFNIFSLLKTVLEIGLYRLSRIKPAKTFYLWCLFL